MSTVVLERSRIPRQSTGAELSLPLTFFDMFWSESGHHMVQRLFFYRFPCSKSHFAGEIAPSLKSSLSLALKHFPSFAGTFLNPSAPGEMPAIRCKNGDSVDLILAESEDDLCYFVSDEPRDSDRFYQFLPELKKPEIDAHGSTELVPLLAVQVTHFPDRGVSIGLTNHHVVGDASATTRFVKAWALMCRHGGDTEFLAVRSLGPNYDRSLINDRYRDLNEKIWNQQKGRKASNKEKETATAAANHGANKVRATFVMDRAQVQKLKDTCKKGPEVRYVSTFSATCAYVWTCLVRSSAAITGTEDGPEHFLCAADLRARMSPPLPPNYSGNVVYPLVSRSERGGLTRGDGFVAAARAIGGSIRETLIENEVDAAELVEEMSEKMKGLSAGLDLKRLLSVAGSPLFDVYEADFGWGRPRKFELVSIDVDGAMSLCRSRDLENGLEISLSMEKAKMDAFADIFNNGLSLI